MRVNPFMTRASGQVKELEIEPKQEVEVREFARGPGPAPGAKRRHVPWIMDSQAGRIINAFGGPYRLRDALRLVSINKSRHAASIYRWVYPTCDGGTGGYVPNNLIDAVIQAAKLVGVTLTDSMWAPGPQNEVTPE